MSSYDRKKREGLGFATTGREPPSREPPNGQLPRGGAGLGMVNASYAKPASGPQVPMSSGGSIPMNEEMPMDSDNGYNLGGGDNGYPQGDQYDLKSQRMYEGFEGGGDHDEETLRKELADALNAAGGDEETYAAVDAWRKKMQEMGVDPDTIARLEQEVTDSYGDGQGIAQ